ncbi:MAG: hypothetical protein AAF208_11915 [Cyanobacteria bacterium P01_A01_bin.45]
MSIPLIIMFGVFSELGVTTLNCKRVEPTQVSCEKQQSKFFGFTQQPTKRFSQVKSAEFKSKEGIDNDGDRTIENWVTLVTSTGEVTLVEDVVSVNGVRGSANEMQAIATQINNFIQSKQPSLLIQRDLRWYLDQSLSIFGFCSLFLLIGTSVLFISFRSENLIFDKNSGNLICEQKTLLGNKRKYYLLNEITGSDVEITTNSDGDTFYELKLLPKSTHKKIRISSSKLQDVKNIQTTIRDFLQLS